MLGSNFSSISLESLGLGEMGVSQYACGSGDFPRLLGVMLLTQSGTAFCTRQVDSRRPALYRHRGAAQVSRSLNNDIKISNDNKNYHNYPEHTTQN